MALAGPVDGELAAWRSLVRALVPFLILVSEALGVLGRIVSVKSGRDRNGTGPDRALASSTSNLPKFHLCHYLSRPMSIYPAP